MVFCIENNLNVRSLNSNFDNLQLFIERLKIKPIIIICVETCNLAYYKYFNLDSYKIFYNNICINRADSVVVYILDGVTETTNTANYGRLTILNTKLQLNQNFKISALYRCHDLSRK